MPEPHELFTNVYVKGYGVEVLIISSLYSSHLLFHSDWKMTKYNANLNYKPIKL